MNLSDGKRVNFRLDKRLFILLSDKAEIGGVAKSKLIRQWLSEPGEIRLFQSEHIKSRTVAFNFLVSKFEYKRLKDIAKRYGLSISSFLRLLIVSKINRDYVLGMRNLPNRKK